MITGDPKVGDNVYVRWIDSDPEDEYDPAKIKSVNNDGTFQVTYFNADFSIPAATVAAQAAVGDPHAQYTDQYFADLAASEPEKISNVPSTNLYEKLDPARLGGAAGKLTAKLTIQVPKSSMYMSVPGLVDTSMHEYSAVSKLQDEWRKFKIELRQAEYELVLGQKTIREFATMVLGTSGLVAKYPNLCTLLSIMLCIPASSAESERTFSAQNIIKTKNRTTMEVDVLDALLRIYRLSRIYYFRDYVATLNTKKAIKQAKRRTTAMCIRAFDAGYAMRIWILRRKAGTL